MRPLHSIVCPRHGRSGGAALAAVVAAFGLCANAAVARADDAVAPLADGPGTAADRARTSVEIRSHIGMSDKQEPPGRGLFPSLIVGQQIALSERLIVEARLSASKVTAEWENIGGVANGFVGALTRGRAATWRYRAGLGITIPLDRSIPAADCFSEPPRGAGDSLTYSYGDDTGCWDRSAYRRAALNRGAWDVWMWAPDWVTAVATGRLEQGVARGWRVAVDAGLGAAVAIGDGADARDNGRAALSQAAVEAMYLASGGRRLGARGMAAGVFLSDTSPFIASFEGVAGITRGNWAVEARLTLPLLDLRNDDVSPGLGGYRIIEQWSVGFVGAIAY